jgi:hypothetical protein
MMSSKRGSRLDRWIMVSILIHLGMLLLPSSILDVFFPPEGAPRGGGPRDLTPDFAHVAFAVVEMTEPLAYEPQAAAVPDVPDIELPQTVSEVLAGKYGRGPNAGGDTPPQAAGNRSQLFPPIPLLVVPPTLDDLEVASLDVIIRVLVNVNGRPETIILPESLVDHALRKRILQCARRFRFQPARKGDLPVASWIDLPIAVESSEAR